MKELKEILKAVIDDLEKTAIQLEALKAASTGKNAKTTAELAYSVNANFYNKLRNKVDALP